MIYDVVIVGGGPSGMACAISTKQNFPYLSVALIEKQEVLGLKLSYTGGGRCNVTSNLNQDEILKNIPRNPKFLYSALNNFGPSDIIAFFEENNCPLKEEPNHKMFPISNKSASIIETLQNKIYELGVDLFLNTEVLDVKDKVIYTNKQVFEFDKLVLATGGITFKKANPKKTGYEIAKKVGHSITDLFACEVPLVSSDPIITSKELQGVSIKDVIITVNKHEVFGDMLFTHFGISGPAAIRSSHYLVELFPGKYLIELDLLREISNNEILDLLEKQNYDFLQKIPKRVLTYFNFNKSLKLEEQEKIIRTLKKLPLYIHQILSLDAAFVTLGGINIKEISPKTMQSKLNKDYYFVGELVDLSGYTGGFNITIALSTGFLCGTHIGLT